MRLLYFSKYSTVGPSSRYRIFQFEKLYRDSGVDLSVQPLFDDRYFEILRGSFPTLHKIPYTLERFKKRRDRSKDLNADLVVIEQQLFPYLPFALEKRLLPPRYIVEFDDALYLIHPRKFPQVLKKATAVIAGNRWLAEYAAQYNQNVHVIPTVLDTNAFSPGPRAKSQKVCIGWSGLEYNFGYLKTFSPVLKRLALRFPTVEIVVLSGSPPQNLDFPFRFVKWNSQTEASQINEFDIGIMPLKDDEWSRGKCGMKLLQFMSLSIPAVASAVGVNTMILRDGFNGFLAKTEQEWEDRLSMLVLDEQLRNRLGREARATVEKDFSVATWFPKLLEVLKRYA